MDTEQDRVLLVKNKNRKDYMEVVVNSASYTSACTRKLSPSGNQSAAQPGPGLGEKIQQREGRETTELPSLVCAKPGSLSCLLGTASAFHTSRLNAWCRRDC
ncbi:hypothetical protein CapIbe_019912 [Capra ibex]